MLPSSQCHLTNFSDKVNSCSSEKSLSQADPARARSPTQRSRGSSPTHQGGSNDPVRSRAAQLEAIVAQACKDNTDAATVRAQLQALGASAAEAEDVLDQIIQQRARATGPDEPSDEPDEPSDNRNSVDAVAWALFEGKLDAARQVSSRNASAVQDLLRSVLGSKQATSSTSGGIPASVLADAPFLSELDSASSSDPHLAETLRLRKVYRTEKATDSIIDKVEGNPSVEEPISRAIWKDILGDKYINFDKLLGELEYG